MISSARIAIIATHPIQYQAPWFRAMAAHPKLESHVYYCHVATPEHQAQAGFGVHFDWDVPLLDGYPYTVLRNVADGGASGGFTSLDTPEIGAVIARERYDAVIALGWQFKSFWQAILACWRLRIPVMIRGDSHLHTERPLWKRAAKYPLYRLLMSRFDAYLAVGSWSRQYFLHYGARHDQVFHVPHVVDTDTFARQSATLRPERQALRSRWALQPEQTVYLFAGKFTSVKRPMDFIRAIETAARDSRVAGLMVGDGPLRAACEEYVRSRKVPVQFTGFLNQSEIVKSYVAADALVLLSDETWGMVVNEAFACQLPCIISERVGCGSDLVSGRGTGSIFPYGDVDRLAAVLEYYAGNRDTLKRMGERALRTSAEFRPTVAVNGVVEALGSLARTGTGGGSHS
jgi:glycosyltransferase involved in cell wall biosynthesis